ncbi:MerR family transcriptional regulator [Actinoplanes sp. CA-030573]|uniref:MerR family transcriptional regulator n=1 Tax=Actinoplanes sp. CA-030573 TaxID=3239898 RepID=UPI003D91A665
MADEALSAGAVARRLGVAVTTLRTWHQRYGLGPSRHVPGQHRRYTTQDLDRLEVMLRLTTQGVAPAEAAAWARRTSVSPPPPSSPAPPPPAAPAARSSASSSSASSSSASSSARSSSARDGGGQAIPLGSVTPAARGLARAAMRLDAPAMREILQEAVAERGVIGAWDEVALPVLIGVGERYAATKKFVEVEHLISRSVSEVLAAVPRPGGREVPRVLLAAADEEQHTLSLEALDAALAAAGVPSRLLGGRVPPGALADAIARTGPAVVVLWSQMPSTGDAGQLTRITGVPLIAAAGPGWPHDLPPGVVQLTSLASALEVVKAALA